MSRAYTQRRLRANLDKWHMHVQTEALAVKSGSEAQTHTHTDANRGSCCQVRRWKRSHALVEIKTTDMHKCVQSAIIVQRKEELLWCRLQAYAKTSHRPARSFQQKNAQEASSVDVFRNTLVQNMVQHSFSNHVDHIRRQTHGPTHTHGIFLRSNWHVHVHARTHTYTP